MTTDKHKLWDFDRIVTYFEDRLPAGEVKEIDRFIEQNEEYARWIDDMYDGWLRNPEAFRAKTDELQKQLLEQIQKTEESERIGREEDQSAPPTKSRLRKLIIYASGAIAAILCIALLFWSSLFSACDLQDALCIARQGDGLHKERFTELSTGTSVMEQVSAVARAYSSGAYQRVIELSTNLQAAPLSANQAKELTLLQGIAHLQLGNTAEALGQFTQLTDSADPYYRINAQWYAALSYLQTEDYQNARPLLENIVTFDGQHSQLARKLLAKLRWTTLFRG